MLEVENIECRYGKANVLHKVSVDVKQGELVTLIGANGAGKSSTLRAISGLLPPVSGRISFLGEDITNASPRRILEMGIAHCPEGRRIFPFMTVEENLEIGAYRRNDRKQIADDMDGVYHRFPVLGERRGQAAGTLSGGEQQMLAIGRALMSRPKLVIFDEPSLGLAPNNVQKTFDYIMEINRQGTTVLMVEQNAYAALEMCDRSFLLESGQIALHGRGEDLIRDQHVRRAYLGDEG
ncbi:ABC transporter ATP-binding protein [Pseudaminobacter sp. 19-2017]|uniref:ABC transporter ATP-binding protein n=1 Tax=Pseudaminobacter soli (ex Zhang et al. 2022) TaxID=2831468 RepID=A0A942IAT6_9HYPH|nr:ABC transporter ATP-binding protein [Pseudaminobacter soli]MBS3651635.1 ABC transporter ATP-binding protein [Pseudaminobacter soli]